MRLKHRISPCDLCPFVRKNGLRLETRARVGEVLGQMLRTDGGEFPCHKTARVTAGGFRATVRSLHCAGALIFAEKHGNATQWMRWMERIGAYDHRALKGARRVFDSLKEAMATAFENTMPRRRRRTQ